MTAGHDDAAGADARGDTGGTGPAGQLRRVAIVGAGLIGASIGLALRSELREPDVLLVDTDPEVVARAAAAGAGRPWDGAAVDLAVVATPPSGVNSLVQEWLGLSRTVSDVAGVKAHARLDVQPHRRYVGSHPMAGSHRGGVAAARVDLFRGRSWAVCPEGSDPAAVADVISLVRACGAHPVLLPAEAHDESVALLSHLPQVVSSALAAQFAGLSPERAVLAGPGVRDTTRVAGSPVGLWLDVLPRVADVLGPLVREVGQRLVSLADELADPGAIEAFLRTGQDGVARLPGRHSSTDHAMDEVVTEIEDAPGALAAITGIAFAAGVNIDDLRVEHAPATLAGSLRLLVPAGQGERLQRALQAAGRSAGLVSDSG